MWMLRNPIFILWIILIITLMSNLIWKLSWLIWQTRDIYQCCSYGGRNFLVKIWLFDWFESIHRSRHRKKSYWNIWIIGQVYYDLVHIVEWIEKRHVIFNRISCFFPRHDIKKKEFKTWKLGKCYYCRLFIDYIWFLENYFSTRPALLYQ
jgi:hypothetical protein